MYIKLSIGVKFFDVTSSHDAIFGDDDLKIRYFPKLVLGVGRKSLTSHSNRIFVCLFCLFVSSSNRGDDFLNFRATTYVQKSVGPNCNFELNQ